MTRFFFSFTLRPLRLHIEASNISTTCPYRRCFAEIALLCHAIRTHPILLTPLRWNWNHQSRSLHLLHNAALWCTASDDGNLPFGKKSVVDYRPVEEATHAALFGRSWEKQNRGRFCSSSFSASCFESTRAKKEFRLVLCQVPSQVDREGLQMTICKLRLSLNF